MLKVRRGDQELASDFTNYVDDFRVASGSAKEAWRASRRVGLIWQYLVLKDASRKRRVDRQDRGPWIGAKVRIIYGSIYQLRGEGKWAKTRIIIKKWLQRVALGAPLDCKELQSDRGLMNYVF